MAHFSGAGTLMVAVAVACQLAACTSGTGSARLVEARFDPAARFDDRHFKPQVCDEVIGGPPPTPEAYDQEPAAFAGLLRASGEQAPSARVRYIFHTHGMGLTRRCDFTTSLLKGLVSRGYRRTGAPGDWIPAATRKPWHVRGDASACEGPAAALPPCRFDSFGDYRIDRLSGPGGDAVVVVSYYWHLDLWRVQFPYLHDDLEQNPGFVSAPLKQGTIDGGLGDAAAYLGELGGPLREGMATAICAMVRDAAGSLDRQASGLETCLDSTDRAAVRTGVEFGFLSHSLGSRMLYDVLTGDWSAPVAEEGRATQAVALELLAARTSAFFMAANQLPLLGPGRVSVTASPPHGTPGVPVQCAELPSLFSLRCALRAAGDPMTGDAPLDVVAFHDPGDLLGYRASGGMARTDAGVRFFTVEHRNTPQILWAGSWPLAAHDQELERETALGLILCGAVAEGVALRPRRCGAAG